MEIGFELRLSVEISDIRIQLSKQIADKEIEERNWHENIHYKHMWHI